MLVRFKTLKLASAISAALLVAGCNGGSGTKTVVSPPVNSADINPWLNVTGDWALLGAGKALRVSSSEVVAYQYNQSGCVKTQSFDLAEGLSLYNVIEKTAAGLQLKGSSDTHAQTYQSSSLPAHCAQPLTADATPQAIFNYVFAALSDYYAHFEARDINWQHQFEKYAPLINDDTSAEQLQNVLAELIAQLNDANVVLSTDAGRFSGSKTVPLQQAAKAMVNNAMAYGESLTAEQAYAQLKGIYTNIQKSYVNADTWQQDLSESPTPNIAWGVSDDNVGFLVLNDLTDVEPQLVTQALSELSATDGVLLDMRDASSVNSQITDSITAHFVASSEDIYQSKVSNESASADEMQTHVVTGNDAAYQNPVYVITSQGTVGTAERLVLALQSQAHIKVVGEQSGGAVSIPLELALPNGWQLTLPNAVAKTNDGDILSVSGITPDISAPAYTQTSTRELKFESYQRALMDMGKFEYTNIAVADYEAKMTQLMAQGLIPGAAVAVVKGGEIVYSQGFGKADEHGRAVNADTPFFVASISKTILGTTIAQAEAAGLMSADDDIETALSFDIGYPVDTDFRPSLTHLMTHTAGLSDDGMIDLCTYYFADDHTSLANWFFGQPVCSDPINPDLGEHLSQYFDPQGTLYKPTHFSSNYGAMPGTVNRYSNYGAGLAAHALEAATNKSLVELTNEYVINPLGMTNTVWSVDGIPVDTARRYMVNADGVATPLRDYLSVAYPAGGAVSTANDLAKYMAAAMNVGVYQGEQKLSAQGVVNMLSSQSDVPTTERGVGYFWRLDGDYFSHNGGDFGVLADAWADTHNDIAVVLLTNGDVLHSPAIGSMIGMFAASKAFAYGLQ